MKRCPLCGETKALAEFHKRSDGTAQSYCKPCRRVKTLAWQSDKKGQWREYIRKWQAADYARNPEKYKAKNRARREANLEKRARNRGFASAADRVGPCDICGTVVRRVWDHDHATGATRGYLCNNCNTALGLLADSTERVQALLDYLVRAA